MKRRTLLFIFFLAVFAVSFGVLKYKYFGTWSEQLRSRLTTPTPAPSSTVAEGSLLSAEELELVNKVYATLSEEQKIDQLFAVPFTINDKKSASASAMSFFTTHNVGTVTLFGSQVSTTSAVQAVRQIRQLKANSLVQPFIAVDHEGGKVQRLNGKGFTVLPSWQEVCELPSEKQEQLLASSAAELGDVGVDVVFAPVVDLKVPTRNTSLGNRICADDPEKIKQTAEKFISRFRAEKMFSVIKHYPGIGGSVKDTHLQPESLESIPAARNIFIDLLRKNPELDVMTSHVVVSNFDGKLPCSLSSTCIGSLPLAEDQLFYSDALEMQGVLTPLEASTSTTAAQLKKRELAEVAVDAVWAGNTVLVFGPGVSSTQLGNVYEALLKEYQQDSTFRQLVDENVKRILRKKALLMR